MPSRMLRDYTLSDKVNELSWQAECLFIRLMMKADDFGSYHGNVKIIKAQCFALRTDSVRDADITRWMDELQKSGLIAIYTHAGKQYMRILDFNQRLRSMRNKFPDPTPDSDSPPIAAIRCNTPPEEKRREEEEEAPSSTDFLAKKAEQLQEYFFRVAPHLTNQERTAEISKFLNKYPDVAANKAGALVNAWVGNMGKNSGKKMVY